MLSAVALTFKCTEADALWMYVGFKFNPLYWNWDCIQYQEKTGLVQ